MSRDQAVNKARAWNRIAAPRHASINYRAEEWGKDNRHAVVQYYGERPVGIAAS